MLRNAPLASLGTEQRRKITSKMMGGQYLKAEIVRKKGKNLLSDPIFNKGLGFPRAERDRLGIRGLLPSQMYILSKSLAF